jgi:hypothetical protein
MCPALRRPSRIRGTLKQETCHHRILHLQIHEGRKETSGAALMYFNTHRGYKKEKALLSLSGCNCKGSDCGAHTDSSCARVSSYHTLNEECDTFCGHETSLQIGNFTTSNHYGEESEVCSFRIPIV